MFLQNKYSLWYNSIINNAKSQERTKKNGNYYESHHIIPKSLGGNNKNENKVLLTAREHYICHLLLPKMCISSKHIKNMCFALYSMRMKNEYHQRYNSKLFEYFRKSFVKHLSGENNHNFGKQYFGKTNPNFGNKWTEEQKQQLSNVRKEKFANGTLISATLGLKRNDLSERNKLKKYWVNNGEIDKQIIREELDYHISIGFKKGRLFKLDKKPSNILKRRNGEIIILPEWLKKNTYQDRIRKGWKHEDAISIPLLPN